MTRFSDIPDGWRPIIGTLSANRPFTSAEVSQYSRFRPGYPAVNGAIVVKRLLAAGLIKREGRKYYPTPAGWDWLEGRESNPRMIERVHGKYVVRGVPERGGKPVYWTGEGRGYVSDPQDPRAHFLTWEAAKQQAHELNRLTSTQREGYRFEPQSLYKATGRLPNPRRSKSHPLERLRHHVTGAIERGEAEPIVEQSYSATYAPKGFDQVGARELELYAENDGDRQQFVPIIKNLTRKMQKGAYDPEKAVKLWMYFVDNAARKYVREFGSGGKIDSMFNRATRLHVARGIERSEREKIESGEYSNLTGYVGRRESNPRGGRKPLYLRRK